MVHNVKLLCLVVPTSWLYDDMSRVDKFYVVQEDIDRHEYPKQLQAHPIKKRWNTRCPKYPMILEKNQVRIGYCQKLLGRVSGTCQCSASSALSAALNVFVIVCISGTYTVCIVCIVCIICIFWIVGINLRCLHCLHFLHCLPRVNCLHDRDCLHCPHCQHCQHCLHFVTILL